MSEPNRKPNPLTEAEEQKARLDLEEWKNEQRVVVPVDVDTFVPNMERVWATLDEARRWSASVSAFLNALCTMVGKPPTPGRGHDIDRCLVLEHWIKHRLAGNERNNDTLSDRLMVTLNDAIARITQLAAERDLWREEHLATVGDLKPLMDYAESVAPVETWGENVCAWAVQRITTLEQERDIAQRELREIARVCDTLSPQEFLNHSAAGCGDLISSYKGAADPNRSIIELMAERDALRAMWGGR